MSLILVHPDMSFNGTRHYGLEETPWMELQRRSDASINIFDLYAKASPRKSSVNCNKQALNEIDPRLAQRPEVTGEVSCF